MAHENLLADLSAHEVRRLLNYDPRTGFFTRAVRSGKAHVGKRAGCANASGHLQISINSRLYMAHRLAFVWMTGCWPTMFIDHRDGNPANNCWSNLRQARLRPERSEPTQGALEQRDRCARS